MKIYKSIITVVLFYLFIFDTKTHMPQDVLEFALSSRMTTSAGIKGESHHVWLEVFVLKVENKTVSVFVPLLTLGLS